MQKMIGNLKQDLRKYYLLDLGKENPALFKKLELWVNNFGLHCVVIYRFGQWASRLYKKNKLLGIIPGIAHRIISFFIKGIHHVDIDAASIGPGFYIGHVGTIYMGPCKIGNNFSVTHNVTLGWGYSKDKAGVPTIGDNVWIGTGAIITGAVTIGNGTTILAGSVVPRSIPDRCLVGGNPGKVLVQNYDNKKLFDYQRFEKDKAHAVAETQ
ncbi:MAG: serine acetyltransferase [Candidatus Pacebacteria bacterium]|nr:serine acetyltransferase [Candidatus Paceibacterota bacterium]